MRLIKIMSFIFTILFCLSYTPSKAEERKRAMTFMDIIQMKSHGMRGSSDISPDGNWFVYLIRVPDLEKNRRYSDIYMTPLSGGKTKQMTFTRDKNEYSPKWFMDSSFFAFLSNRSDDKTQIYFMKADGGKARRVTDDRYGVRSYEWSRCGKYLAYLGGDSKDRQIWIMPGKGGKAEKLTSHKIPIRSFLWDPKGMKIYFVDRAHFWEIDIETKKEKRLTGDDEYSVSNMVISDDGKKIGFVGKSKKSEVYLLDLKTNTISQITNNSVDEWSLSFSPDGRWLAFIREDGEMVLNPWGKIYIVPTKGGETKKLLSNFEYYDDLSYFWSEDSGSIYFTSQVGMDYCLFNVSLDDDRTKKIAQFSGATRFNKDEDSGKFFISYSDPENPEEYYYSAPENFVNRDKWIKITDVNPQVKGFLLGKYETVQWESADGRTIEGLLIKPINYIEDKKYPLIVDIHGGPFSAETNRFKAHIQIYSANDYLVFQPNYRGSTGYGEKFKKDIAGDYFSLPLADIMTGVDYLIEREIVDPNRIGIMGWSAGGGICNWALVSTDRFKAISTGAASEIPKKHIKNAKTPTLIHCGENDRNNIRESEELYKTLKKFGVPTEFIVYPNSGHVIGVVEYGFGNMRQLMLEIQSDFYWFEKWIRGKEKGWIDCKEIIETLKKTGRIEEPLRKTSRN